MKFVTCPELSGGTQVIGSNMIHDIMPSLYNIISNFISNIGLRNREIIGVRIGFEIGVRIGLRIGLRIVLNIGVRIGLRIGLRIGVRNWIENWMSIGFRVQNWIENWMNIGFNMGLRIG